MSSIAFPLKTNVVFIPFFIAEQCRRNGLDIKECATFDRIRSFITTNDMVEFLVLQKNLPYCLGVADHYHGDLLDVWSPLLDGPNPRPHNNATREESHNYIYDTLVPLSRQKQYEDSLANRLFHPEAYENRHTEAFTTHDLGPNIIGVVLYPTYFSKGLFADQQRSLITNILKLLYVYNTKAAVSSTVCFERYLQLLSETTVIV